MAPTTSTRTWTADGDRLRCRIDVHPTLRRSAEAYVLHRLRQLRAMPQGFHHPLDARLEGGELVVDFAPGTLSAPAPLNPPYARDVKTPSPA